VRSRRATEPADRAQHPADFGCNARPPHRASKSSRPGDPTRAPAASFRIDGPRTFKGLAPTTSKGRLAENPPSPEALQAEHERRESPLLNTPSTNFQ